MSRTEEEGTAHSAYTDLKALFREHYPYYLSIGMTSEEYWSGSPDMVQYYREAADLRLERKNQELWLQGYYIYHALADVSPLFRFSMKGGEVKANEYLKRPVPITAREREQQELLDAQKRQEEFKQMMMERVRIAAEGKKNVNNRSVTDRDKQ